MRVVLKQKLAFLNKDINKKKNNNIELLEEFSLFLGRGHSINEAIKLLMDYFDLTDLEANLLKGLSFADSIKVLNYSDDIILLIRINEQNGQLLNGINEAINLIEVKQQNRNQLISQLRYPLFLLGMIFCVIVFVNNLVLPQILNLYASFGVDIPVLISIFLTILQLMPLLMMSLIVLIGACIFSFNLISFETKIKYISKIPYVGREYKLIYNASFISYLHSLLKSGISIKEAIGILMIQNENKMLRNEARKINQQMNNGKMFVESLSKNLYLKSTITVFLIGINQNNLLMCLETAIIKTRRKQRIKKQRMLFLIQPIIYGVIGIIIIIIYGLIFNICYGLID